MMMNWGVMEECLMMNWGVIDRKNIVIGISIVFALLLSACGSRQAAAGTVETTAAGEDSGAADTQTTAPVSTVTAAEERITAAAGETPAVGETAADTQESETVPAVFVTAGGNVYQAVFYDNEAARELVKRMPMELTMEELHGNEKYFYLPDSLPTETENSFSE